MNEAYERDIARYWSGLAILERLSEIGTALTSEEVATILGVRSVKGIGSALSGTRSSLGEAGIRLDEAVRRHSGHGYTVWTAGPRIRQARHALEHARRRWTRRERRDSVPVEEAPPEHPGPVLVLRALRSRGTVYRVDGTMADLDAILDARTVARAIDRWRKAQAKHANELVVAREIRIAKSQPRPTALQETSRAVQAEKVPN